jgi:hypothetical protein
MNEAHEALRDMITATHIAYPFLEFPVRHIGGQIISDGQKHPLGTFMSSNGQIFTWHISGVCYVAERNVRYAYSDFSKPFRQGKYDELAALVNQAMDELRGARGNRYVGAMYNGQVVGILRQYNPVFHSDLLQLIEDAGLASSVVRGSLDAEKMVVDLDVRVEGRDDVIDQDGLHVGIRVVNGHSGHIALHYRLLIKARSFEYTKPLRKRARHMAGVTEIKNALEDALCDVAAMKVDQQLLALDVPECLRLMRSLTVPLSARQESLLHLAEHAELHTALDVVLLFGQYGQTRGQGNAVNGLITPLIEYLLDL